VRSFLPNSLNPLGRPSPHHQVLARFHLARLHERAGRPAEARAEHERFLKQWGHADRPVPQVDEARQALARLK